MKQVKCKVLRACRIGGQSLQVGDVVTLGTVSAKYPLLEGKIQPFEQVDADKKAAKTPDPKSESASRS